VRIPVDTRNVTAGAMRLGPRRERRHPAHAHGWVAAARQPCGVREGLV